MNTPMEDWAGMLLRSGSLFMAMAESGVPWRPDGAVARQLAHSRSMALVQYAATHSPIYRELYRGIDLDKAKLTDLPPVSKKTLMSRFDEWSTDDCVTRQGVQEFIGDPLLAGQYYLGKYAIWTSSGTTGEPGIFLHDRHALAVYDTLAMTRVDPAVLSRSGAKAAGRLGPAALIAATGGHFAGVASWERLRREYPWFTQQASLISVSTPLHFMIQELNSLAPAFIASYPSVLVALAQAQQRGQLAIKPSLLWSGGELLTSNMRALIEQVFDCALVNEYGASECMCMAFECMHGYLHINSDWVHLEPVDRDYLPVAHGEPSHTVLLTNLANRVQPMIRYDLGDSMTIEPSSCACGSQLPAMRVEGRTDDTLYLRNAAGAQVLLLPIMLTTFFEESLKLYRFQIRQIARDRLEVRLAHHPGGQALASRQAIAAALGNLLRGHGLANIQVSMSPLEPSVDERSGKFRRVMGIRAA
jgi:phenylacetate-coenzyme A ligase PaaK-like adenylate-forming protein